MMKCKIKIFDNIEIADLLQIKDGKALVVFNGYGCSDTVDASTIVEFPVAEE